MATALSSSRCRGHGGCFLHLVVAAAAVLAALVLGAARAEAAGSSGDRVLLDVASLFPGSSCATPQGLYIGEDKEAIVAGAVQLKKVAMMYAQARDPGAKTDGEMVQGRLLLTDG